MKDLPSDDAKEADTKTVPTSPSSSVRRSSSDLGNGTTSLTASTIPTTLTTTTGTSNHNNATASLPNSPHQKRSSKLLPPLKVPLSHKLPPLSSNTTATATEATPTTTPIASPSSVSISSKATIKTGFGQHMSNRFAAPTTTTTTTTTITPASVDQTIGPMSSSVVGNIRRSNHVRSASLNSPKLSSTPVPPPSSTRKKISDPMMAATAREAAALLVLPQQQPTLLLDHPPLLAPRKASKCPLFCCFYAEFDNIVGPKICFESPLQFMEQSTDVNLQTIHKLLASNFDRILAEHGSVKHKKHEDPQSTKSTIEATSQEQEQQQQQQQRDGTETPNAPSSTSLDGTTSPLSPSSQTSLPASRSGESIGTVPVNNTSATTTSARQQQRVQDTISGSTQHSAGSGASSKNNNKADTASTMATASVTAAADSATTTSIFDSCSDFIITGAELSGTIVNLSAYNMHLLTRPTVIHDNRYERNSLLFCVGFILRRTEDPRPFRPLLSKLALTLKRLEMESHFLSNRSTRPEIQPLLDRLLVSLNGTFWESNLVVHNNVLNLKLFHPPKYPVSPVADHKVPILLKRDWQIQMYDWDLAINWVVLHIDGVANARQISKKAEVDMEMVRNCLRVLKHHEVISMVDMFFYSNRYESTERAASMLAGQEPSLLHDAAEYVLKLPQEKSGMNIQATAPTPYSNLMAPMSPPTASPTLQERFVRPHTPVGVHPGTSPASPIPSSFPPNEQAAALSSSLLGSSLKYATYASFHSHDAHIFGALRREEQRELKMALAELYSAFNRNVNFGDLWVALAAEKPRSQSMDKSAERNRSGGTTKSDTVKFAYTQQGPASRSASYTRADSTEFTGSIGSREQDTNTMSSKERFLERLRKKSTCSGIDWATIFDNFDHRRFISFGLVNGLLQRVHNYPFLLDSGPRAKQKQNSSFSSGHHYSMEDPAGRVARNAASMMDGLHCDDHIASVFQTPINKLIEKVEKAEGRKVLSLYSAASTKW